MTREEVNDQIRTAIRAPLRSQVSTSDIVQFMSSTKLSEVMQDIEAVIDKYTAEKVLEARIEASQSIRAMLMADTNSGLRTNNVPIAIVNQYIADLYAELSKLKEGDNVS